MASADVNGAPYVRVRDHQLEEEQELAESHQDCQQPYEGQHSEATGPTRTGAVDPGSAARYGEGNWKSQEEQLWHCLPW